MRNALLLLCALLPVSLGACRQEPTPVAQATHTPALTPTETHTPTATSPPTATPVPSETPTPAPLTPADIFRLVSPAIADVVTPIGSGSGFVIEDGYLVTNAHVVWPFDNVRVVLPDGREQLEVPVIAWDLSADLAVLGPLADPPPALTIADGEALDTGSNVFLIGYPGEADDFPQPTIVGGLISGMREWESLGISYFQTDAPTAGGQSGGGPFGLDAEITFEADGSYKHTIAVQDSWNYQTGGYSITVSEPLEGGPTPMALPVAATPTATDYGLMALHEDDFYGYAVPYPFGWQDLLELPEPPEECVAWTACYGGGGDLSPVGNLFVLILTKQESAEFQTGNIDLLFEALFGLENLSVRSEEMITTTQGHTGVLSKWIVGNEVVMAISFYEGAGEHDFLVLFVAGQEEGNDLPGFMRYSFENFRME